jgi:hypothetical protein
MDSLCARENHRQKYVQSVIAAGTHTQTKRTKAATTQFNTKSDSCTQNISRQTQRIYIMTMTPPTLPRATITTQMTP